MLCTAYSISVKEFLGRLWHSVEEGVVNVALVPLCVKQVAVVLIERSILAPSPGEVRVG